MRPRALALGGPQSVNKIGSQTTSTARLRRLRAGCRARSSAAAEAPRRHPGHVGDRSRTRRGAAEPASKAALKSPRLGSSASRETSALEPSSRRGRALDGSPARCLPRPGSQPALTPPGHGTGNPRRTAPRLSPWRLHQLVRSQQRPEERAPLRGRPPFACCRQFRESRAHRLETPDFRLDGRDLFARPISTTYTLSQAICLAQMVAVADR
jgi:hypothetical protein